MYLVIFNEKYIRLSPSYLALLVPASPVSSISLLDSDARLRTTGQTMRPAR